MKTKEEIIEGILAKEKENSEIHINIVRKYLEKAIEETLKEVEKIIDEKIKDEQDSIDRKAIRDWNDSLFYT